ncbi:MAG: alpha/beta fold hydrolase [Chloroflexi bacterium]|nr:alpha/beta fold hydrolase [Chloroflexota bacterium]MCI0874267.1 alpha/beta fold hydrolase [Chloroflexota bacterium]MCI0880945.1 alpha/beta fold hydrolase [Chloroflexota bacterium]
MGVAAGGYIGVSSALASGLITTTRVRPDDRPDSVGLDYRDVSFTSRGGDAGLSGWLIRPQSGPGSSSGATAEAEADPVPSSVPSGAGPGHSVTARGISWVAMVHGDNTNRSDSKTGMLDIARALSQRGFGIFMFDMRGRGDSPAAISSSGYYERLDLQGASDYLVSNGADRSRIGVLGFSLGGAVALLAGSNPNNFGAIVSDSAFADLSLVLKGAMTGVKRPLALWFPGMKFMARALYGIDIADVSPARAIARSDTPVLVIHGEEDGVIPVEHARLLGRAIGASFDEIEAGEETVWIVPGAGHTGAFRTQPKTYIDKVARFFEKHLSAPRGT